MNPFRRRHLLLVCADALRSEELEKILSDVANATFEVVCPQRALDRLRDQACDLVIFQAGKSLREGLDLLVHIQARDLRTGLVLVGEDVETTQVALAMRSGASAVLDVRDSAAELAPAVAHGLQQTIAARLMAERQERDRASLALATSKMAAMKEEIASLERATIDALLGGLEAREKSTRAHSARVCAYAVTLAGAVGYPASLMPHLNHAALLHDIGKTALPVELWARHGELPASQLDSFRPHTWLGEKILNGITFLRPAARLVRHHHERWDGSGYPDKLAGENIPLGSRILSLCDALDAITNDQVYRPAQTVEEAVQEISRWTRRQFDPMLIAEFKRIPTSTWDKIRLEFEHSARTSMANWTLPEMAAA